MKGENVLIIDPDASSTSLLPQLMERLSCESRIEEDPGKALNILKEEKFTVVIAETSLLMEEHIMGLQKLHPELCLIFTGDSLEELDSKLDPRVSDFLCKPFTLKDAEFRLTRILLERDRGLQNREAEEALQTAKEELERKKRDLERSEEDLERIKHLYQDIGNELNTTSEKLRKAKDQLTVLAITDGHTEAYNHRYFMDQIREKFEEAKKESVPISLLMIDIDYFKTFNDNHGHMTGDLVLKSIAQILKSGCRQEDIVARYGGEEFAIILPYADAHDAFTVAERIRTKVEQYSVPNGRETQTVTVSIGIGVKGEDAESIDQLISCADRALYRAKATGRNRVALFDKTRAVPNVQWFSRF
jgi:diguanylate cyclase (GGDEF)-like protein